MNLFEFGVNILEESMTLLILSFYFGCKYTGIRKYTGFFITLAVSVFTITTYNYLYISEGFLGLSFVIIYFIYALIFLNGDIYTKLFISGFVNCIVYIISLLSTLFFAEFITQEYSELYGMTIHRIALIATTKILLLIAGIILIKFRVPENKSRRDLILLSLVPIATTMSMVGIMQVFLNHIELRQELLLAALSVAFANIVTYYTFIKIDLDAKKQAELDTLRLLYKTEKNHIRDIKELYEKTCGARHDILHHFTLIQALPDKKSIVEYVNTVTANELGEFRHFIKTDNDYFNAIVNAKIALCDKLGIEINAAVMNHSLSKLKNDEIGVLFGNLFDNAIEAAQKAAKKCISLDVQKCNDNIFISMSNSTVKPVLVKGRLPETNKNDKSSHGFGTKNIRRIVDKYDGLINYHEENNVFCCDIMI